MLPIQRAIIFSADKRPARVADVNQVPPMPSPVVKYIGSRGLDIDDVAFYWRMDYRDLKELINHNLAVKDASQRNVRPSKHFS